MTTSNERAVIYCRVSTEEESQKNALEGQVKEAIHAVEEKEWILVDQYVDAGKSGTTTKHRTQYNRLMRDLECDLFDIIVIKSQDRLMRNTLEWYIFIDKINKNHKKLFFYLENKFYDSSDSLIIGIKAILAEEYSRELSQKVNNANRNRQKECSQILLTNKTWGYDKVNRQVVVNEEEAEIVRLIYDLYIKGYGSRLVSKTLTEMGIKSRSGNDFSYVTIRKIIKNPLYKGDVVMNRLHNDFDSKQVIHVPEEEWIIHKNAVPAIVSAETWQAANNALDSRYKKTFSSRGIPARIGKKKGNYLLSSKIYCGECGNVYWRRYRRNAKDDITVYWSCSEYITQGRKNIWSKNRKRMTKKHFDLQRGCDSPHLTEDALMSGLKIIAESIFSPTGGDSLVAECIQLFENSASNSDEEKIKELDEKLIKTRKQQEKLLDGYLNDDIPGDLYKRKNAKIEEEIRELEAKRAKIEGTNVELKQKSEYIESVKTEIKRIGQNEECVYKLIKLIERITVFQTYMIVNFGVIGEIKMDIERLSYKRMQIVLADDQTAMEQPHTNA